MKYVIIGNGPAAVTAAETIRRVDDAGEITLLSKEDEFTYSRPLISYLLCGKTDETRMRYKPADFYARNRVDFRAGVAAVSIDKDEKTVTGSDGNVYPYDKLLLATGAKPFVPPIPGLESVHYHTFMTLRDAHELADCLTKNTRVLIVGAGLIGMKCLEGIRDRVASVTVCDLAKQVLPSILDAEAAQMVQKHCEAQDVTFLLGDSAARFEPGKAIMQSGKEVEFDELVMAVGVRPATELAQSLGLDAARGIHTNAQGDGHSGHFRRGRLREVHRCDDRHRACAGAAAERDAAGRNLRLGNGREERQELQRHPDERDGHVRPAHDYRGDDDGRRPHHPRERQLQAPLHEGRPPDGVHPRRQRGARGHLYGADPRENAAFQHRL